jgi:hypothetical protein
VLRCVVLLLPVASTTSTSTTSSTTPASEEATAASSVVVAARRRPAPLLLVLRASTSTAPAAEEATAAVVVLWPVVVASSLRPRISSSRLLCPEVCSWSRSHRVVLRRVVVERKQVYALRFLQIRTLGSAASKWLAGVVYDQEEHHKIRTLRPRTNVSTLPLPQKVRGQ